MKARRTLCSPQVFFWIFLLVLTLWTRFFDLTNKPLHFDEGINGWFVMNMQELGFYKYDPNNYHGPLYFYVLQFFESFLGRSISTLRAVPAFFSFLCVAVLALPFFADRAIRTGVALLVLVSPAFLFFGRSGIHEVPFVFFQIVSAIGLLRWLEKKDETALGLFGLGLCGMLLLKETFAITLFSFGVAFLSMGWEKIQFYLNPSDLWKALKKTRLFFVLLLIAFVLFYSGFLRHVVGLVDFVKAFLPWFKTGTHGNGHDKDFFYWLQVMARAEPIVLLGLLVAFYGVFSKNLQLRFMSVFSLVQLLIYSLIPYKTVWCIISLTWGFYFVLVLGARELFMFSTRKARVLGFVLVLVFPFQITSAYQSVFKRPIDLEHPYVYVNSTYQFKDLVEMLTTHSNTVSEAGRKWTQEPIQIGMSEQWPWPWVLRDFQALDYSLCKDKVNPSALVYMCDLADSAILESQIQEAYLKVLVQMRQSREASWIYLKASSFEGLYQGPFEKVLRKEGVK